LRIDVVEEHQSWLTENKQGAAMNRRALDGLVEDDHALLVQLKVEEEGRYGLVESKLTVPLLLGEITMKRDVMLTGHASVENGSK
jgi:hypothetical protein